MQARKSTSTTTNTSTEPRPPLVPFGAATKLPQPQERRGAIGIVRPLFHAPLKFHSPASIFLEPSHTDTHAAHVPCPSIYTASRLHSFTGHLQRSILGSTPEHEQSSKKKLTRSSNGGEGQQRQAAQDNHRRQGHPSALVLFGDQQAVVPHPVSQVPVPAGHAAGGEARDRPRRRAKGGADHLGCGHRRGGETAAGRSQRRGAPAASGVRGRQEAGAQAVGRPDAASLGRQGRGGRHPPGCRPMPVLHAARRRRVAPRLTPMLPRGLRRCCRVVRPAVPRHVADCRSSRDREAAHRSIRHVSDRHSPADIRHGDVRHVLRRLAAHADEGGARLPEAQGRGEDPVGGAGQVQVRPRHHPPAPGRRPRQVQERAARHRPRHGLLRRGRARLLRRRLPPLQALGASAAAIAMQATNLLRLNDVSPYGRAIR